MTILNFDNIPGELKALNQWVCYRLETRDDDDKPVKIPLNANGGARARSDDPSTWSTFEQCQAAVSQRPSRYRGIGFIVAESDPYTVIDLDHCVDESGSIEPWAWKIIHDLDSYSEFSQSGKGIHIIVKAKKPGPRCRLHSCPHPIEIYDHRRFLVMTGNLVPGTNPAIQPAPNEIAELYHSLFGQATAQKPRQGHQAAQGTASGLSDQDLIDKAISARNGPQFNRLWNGDLSDHNYDWSAADQALCNLLAFWTNRDAGWIDRLFRQSGLMRDKWELRADYRERTIGRAIADCREGYEHSNAADLVTTEEANETSKVARRKAGKAKTATLSADDDKVITHLTDYGNARRLVHRHGEDIRYCFPEKDWYIWDGTRWAFDDTGDIYRRAKETVLSIYAEAANPDIEKSERQAIIKHAVRSEAQSRLEAMVTLAKSEPGIAIQPQDFDSDPWLFNCQNGTLDLRTGTLHPHQRDDFCRKQTPVDYDPDVKSDLWEDFLSTVFEENTELIAYLQRVIGYALTGSTQEEQFWVFYGTGRNGKGTMTEVLLRLMGDYGKPSDPKTFLLRDRYDTSPRDDLADLEGVRLTIGSEIAEGKKLDVALVKSITGRDSIRCRRLYRDGIVYIPAFKVFLAANHRPGIPESTIAIWDRVKLIPFNVKFSGENQDSTMKDRLFADLAGILAWAVQGCLDWQKYGLNPPAEVMAATSSYQETEDILSGFLSEKCIILPSARVTVSELYSAYKDWCDTNGEKPIGKRTFRDKLIERGGLESRPGMHGIYTWHGIGLVDENTERIEEQNESSQERPGGLWYV